jgi:hypothetical protein
MSGKIAVKFNMKPLIEKLSQATYHLQEAQKLIDLINSMEAKDLIDHSGSDQ